MPALPATIALAPRLPVSGSAICIEPPLPLQYPASLPSSSANIRSMARALRQAMPMSAMRAGDVIVAAQRFANAHGDGFLTDIQVSEAGHERAGVEIVDLLLEEADHDHAPVHAEKQLRLSIGDVTHLLTPDMRASTSNTMAKSFFARPMRSRRRQHFVGRGGSRQRNVHLAAQLQC